MPLEDFRCSENSGACMKDGHRRVVALLPVDGHDVMDRNGPRPVRLIWHGGGREVETVTSQPQPGAWRDGCGGDAWIGAVFAIVQGVHAHEHKGHGIGPGDPTAADGPPGSPTPTPLEAMAAVNNASVLAEWDITGGTTANRAVHFYKLIGQDHSWPTQVLPEAFVEFFRIWCGL